MDLQHALIEVWRQALEEGRREVELEGVRFAVRLTPRKNLRQIDFTWNGESLRGLEQNPQTGSRWAQLARQGRKVMQFLDGGRYIAVVVDGKITLYGRPSDH